MTLEEPILIFIPRISSSKEPSPPRWLCLALIQLKGKTKESREWGVAQYGVCLERGGYPSTYTRVKVVLLSMFGVKLRGAPPQHGGMPPPQQGEAGRHLEGSGYPLGATNPWPLPLATAFTWQTLGWSWVAALWGFAHFESVWWASPLLLCVN